MSYALGKNRSVKGVRVKKLDPDHYVPENIQFTDQQNYDIFQIYCRNLSGSKSKVRQINHKLTSTEFSAICFQETWFDENITDSEMVSNTNFNFNIFRQDGSDTRHHKKSGGGVVTLINKKYYARRITLNSIEILQYVCISIHLKNFTMLLLNIYVPHGTERTSIPEISRLLEYIYTFKYSEMVVCGDFNLPKIKWEFDSELSGAFMTSMALHDLSQILS